MLKLFWTFWMFVAISGSDGRKVGATTDHEKSSAAFDADPKLFEDEALNGNPSDDDDSNHELHSDAGPRIQREPSEVRGSRAARSANPNNPPNHPDDMASGSVYVRWGHTECPDYSALVYSGVAAGSSYGSAGGGVNTLCLPDDPIYDETTAGIGSYRSFLYAAEYQAESFPSRNDRLWHDIPCAVCKAPSRFAQLMVPGRNTCPTGGWTLEYGGYLMAERTHVNHKRSNFVCVDRAMQMVERTSGVADGGYRALLNFVESRCVSSGGGLPCSPYIDGYELTCAVCTQ